ncbi:MAG: amino acid adenylation domain-containing protein, partial [Proteobacteria bacterium]|nr:amino acid adenylation domain-containing protein [Pseudomonadota bacterium]
KGKTPREIAKLVHRTPDYSTVDAGILKAPLSDSQLGVYLECIQNPSSLQYNIPGCYRFEGQGVCVERLVSALREVIGCFCAFKLRVEVEQGTPFIVRDEQIEENITVVELKDKDIDSFKTAFVKPFELGTGPLYRFEIVRTEASVWLFFDVHHIAFDGASIAILERAISSAYGHKDIEREAVTPLMVAKYEELNASSELYWQAFSYFESKLRGVEVNSNLIVDTPDALLSDKTAEFVYETGISLDETARYLKRRGLTENSLFMGAFGYALAKFTDQYESLFCTVHHGRSGSEIQKTMGMFVRTLPVYVRIDEEATPEDYLRALQEDFFESIRNEQASFVKMANALGIQSDIMFVNHSEHRSGIELDGIRAEYEPVETGAGIANIAFIVAKSKNGCQFRIQYKTCKYQETTVRCLAEMVECIVNGMMVCPKLKEIPLVSDDILRRLDAFNQTEEDYARNKTVVDLLRDQVGAHPDDTAVVYRDKTLSYKAFWNVTDRIAAYIRTRGIGRNEFVAIMIGRSEFMPVTAWGVVKSGAGYVPMDPAYPKERIDFMVRDSGAKLIIADRDLRHLVDGYGVDILFTDEIGGLPESTQVPLSNGEGDLGGEAYIERAMPEDALIMIYTSGTTGVPKGCVLNHGNFAAFHVANRNVWHYTSESRVASYVSFGFDPIYMDIFSSLISGAQLYIIGDDIRLDIAAIDEFYIQNHITCGYMTTQVGRMFIGSTKCKTLRKFMVGGEKLIPIMPPDGIEVVDAYGPTETTCYVTHHIVKDSGMLQPIGRANANTKLYVVDRHINRLPFGACGELCIAGPQVSSGYLNQPEKTSEVFVDNPFCREPDYRRMYKTGDVVRMLPNGEIDILGRRDGQVKIRGYRLELTEVEKVICDYPGIVSAAVIALDAPGGGKQLAAYIVSDDRIDVHALSAFILKTKPSYMVPSSIIQLDAIPLNASGKVDRRKLPKPTLNANKAGLEPATAIERKICEIYQQILGIGNVYADDDFFHIGGTSILALKLVLQCMKAGIPVVYKNVFDNPTPKALAALVETQSSDSEHGLVRNLGADAKVLDYNIEDNIGGIRRADIGRVLLTGATGFLGVHILRELLDTTGNAVVCLVRHDGNLTASERMRQMLVYYFGDSFAHDVSDRIIVVDADITEPALGKKLEKYHFDAIINCAACVKHFAADDLIERTNHGGVLNLISIAQARCVKLIHISTTSVAGESVDGSVPEHLLLRENMLDIGQNIDNPYIRSKYMAEKAMFKAIASGMKGKVLRLGNLMGRLSDGRFQINSQSNAFMRQIKGYIKLGCFPAESLDEPVEFSPVDCCAKACILLAGTPDKFTVFHVNNCHTVSICIVLKALNELGMPVRLVNHGEFDSCFQHELSKDETNMEISGLIAYMNRGMEKHRMAKVDNRYSVDALKRLGFEWPMIEAEYIKKLMQSVFS